MRFDKRIVAAAGAVIALGLLPSSVSAAPPSNPNLGPNVLFFSP